MPAATASSSPWSSWWESYRLILCLPYRLADQRSVRRRACSVNYSHPLQFGTFITPASAAADTPVALARRSEELGLDLVTFQDHPYQPAFLDTWTLLSWVAARTETLRVSANVLNLPLRPPAVVARAAASLDLLSGGRV